MTLDFEVADGLAVGDGATVIGGGSDVPIGGNLDVMTCDVESIMPTIRVKIAGACQRAEKVRSSLIKEQR